MNDDFQLTIDSIATVRALIDTAIESGQVERAWELSGKHALMVRQAANMRAPVVAERMKAEAAVARAAYLASPDQIMRGAAIEQERVRAEREEEETHDRGLLLGGRPHHHGVLAGQNPGVIRAAVRNGRVNQRPHDVDAVDCQLVVVQIFNSLNPICSCNCASVGASPTFS